MVFCGVLGAKLTISVSSPATDAVLLIGRLVEFSLGGLLVDLGLKRLHELEWNHSLNLPAAVMEAQQDGTATRAKEETIKEFLPSGDELHDLARVQGKLEDGSGKIGAYGHKLLLVKELGILRQQERTIRENRSNMDAASVKNMLREIDEKKRQVKAICEREHGVKIARLFAEIQDNAADRLNKLREEQVRLVLAGKPSMGQLQAMDREKAKLKRDAKLALGVKISRHAKPYAKWKHVWRDVIQK